MFQQRPRTADGRAAGEVDQRPAAAGVRQQAPDVQPLLTEGAARDVRHRHHAAVLPLQQRRQRAAHLAEALQVRRGKRGGGLGGGSGGGERAKTKQEGAKADRIEVSVACRVSFHAPGWQRWCPRCGRRGSAA